MYVGRYLSPQLVERRVKLERVNSNQVFFLRGLQILYFRLVS